MKKVVIIGGGVAGMSAAHELIERGFAVEVYERQPVYVGGKARSVDVPDSASPGHLPLPGEHGFRFFPGFYRHIIDTMKRTPLPGQPGKTVYDNLEVSTQSIQAQIGETPIQVPAQFPRSRADLRKFISAIAATHKQFTPADNEKMFDVLWQIMTSCRNRKDNEYEQMSWWQFTDADGHSQAYRDLFVIGLTRTLVAARAETISAKTEGNTLLGLMMLMGDPSGRTDQVLNGPTNDAWLYPWRDYLLSKGVKYHHGHKATAIQYDSGTKTISGVTVADATGLVRQASGDYYLFAVPVEAMAALVKDQSALLNDAPTLRQLQQLALSTDWMNGIQFYLREPVPMLDTTFGHVLYLQTPWALTSISQVQFWKGYDISRYGNGEVKSILSVDISNWETEGLLIKKPANACTPDEIRDEVWYQIQQSLIVNGASLLKSQQEILINWYLDRDISFFRLNSGTPDAQVVDYNKEPLLINEVNTWGMRPAASTAIPNLFLASDYVRTFTDLATMEGANEAARRAVNGILIQSGSQSPFCRVWDLHSSLATAPLRWLDQRRYNRGLPWKNETPWLYELLFRIFLLLDRLFGGQQKRP
ncbi:MAG: FAD-dependent oxidoreductase [Bacteroidia bacterium]|nr:FAD-dependent oxidoreductase [Bacteroidia bacterium]